ncbi:MAG: alpha/beta hydrolase [Nocardioides sp.]
MPPTSVQPQLTTTQTPDRLRAGILFLHGGTSSSTDVGNRSLSWRRARSMQQAIAPEAAQAGVGIWLLRYRVRGWNRTGTDVVADARWALGQLRERVDGPLVLLGHSMGARAAIHVADDPSVTGVVAMAPWWEPGDPVITLTGRDLSAAHGRRDKITSFAMTESYVAEASTVTRSASFTDMGGVGHYMLRQIPTWNRFALRDSLAMLRPEDRPGDRPGDLDDDPQRG